jgi:hypothetical protein
VVVEATDLGDLDDSPSICGMDRAGIGAVRLKRLVRAPVVVVAEVDRENPVGIPVVDHDDMIQAFPPEAALTTEQHYCQDPASTGTLPAAMPATAC